MTDMIKLEARVGITRSARPRERTRSSAPSTASMTIVAALGASSPAAAAAPRGVKVIAVETRLEWRTPEKETTPLRLIPTPIDDSVRAPSPAPVLSEALAFAQLVNRVMPVNEEADREAERALAKHAASRTKRKLSAK
jgi:hypothetical protein